MPAAELAPAKINLFLHVCGRRADGYHLLDSLVVFTAFGDKLEAQAANDVTLRITGPFADGLSAGEDNLVVKAARLLARRTGRAHGAALSLAKHLPVAAGIGGGSSDAAAALRACARLWGADIGIPAAELAAELGADVPVCLAPEPRRMQGIGEVLTAVPRLPAAWLVLVNPRKPLATGPVFKALAGRHSGPAAEFPAAFATMDALADFLARTRNDLAAPATELMPEIAEILADLGARPGCHLARLSGSGPTCFGLFAEQEKAEAAMRDIQTRRANWWTVATPLLRPEN